MASEIRIHVQTLSPAETAARNKDHHSFTENFRNATVFRRSGSSGFFAMAADARRSSIMLARADDYQQPFELELRKVHSHPIGPCGEAFTEVTDENSLTIRQARLETPAEDKRWLATQNHEGTYFI